MLVSCKCLNIIVEANEAEPRVNMKKELYLLCVENFDSFFREGIQEVKFISATKRVPAFVHEKRLGSWIVSYCLNCSVNCYGFNTDNKTALVNSALLMTQEAIDNLKKSREYSPVFKIIVEPVSESLSKPGTAPTGILKKVLTSLQHQLRDTVRDEVLKIEESIRIFTEGLYEKLEEFQKRATKDHKALAHKLRETELPAEEEDSSDDSSIPEINNREMRFRHLKKRRERKSKESRASPAPTEESKSENRQPSPCQDRQTSPCPIKVEPKIIESISPSLDSEGLFYLEGMDDEACGSKKHNKEEEEDEEEQVEEEEEEQEQVEEEEEESLESESHDEGIDVQHEQTPSCNIAKSLPVEIPPHPPHVYVDKDVKVPTEGIDIAASIRALARSVRGDNIFGELPRPRLSSGI